MLADVFMWTAAVLLKITLVSLVLWGVARLVRVRRSVWIRAWLCAAMMFPFGALLGRTVGAVPLVGWWVGALLTGAFWFPVIGGAFDTDGVKSAAILAVAILLYPGWTF